MPSSVKTVIDLEESRLQHVHDIFDYDMYQERHRLFPQIFENRNHKRILDVAAGVGIVGERIKRDYDAELICNDITPKCLNSLQKLGLTTSSFDLDDADKPFPFSDKHFDAIVALATIEHVIHTDNFVRELRRMLTNDGYLYLSAPNYSGAMYLLRMIVTGKTFHDPMVPISNYEFFAHVRYFTYVTLIEYITSFGFTPVKVYLGIPKTATRYIALKKRSKMKALAYKYGKIVLYNLFSPRWAEEPVICFQKSNNSGYIKPQKIIYW